MIRLCDGDTSCLLPRLPSRIAGLCIPSLLNHLLCPLLSRYLFWSLVHILCLLIVILRVCERFLNSLARISRLAFSCLLLTLIHILNSVLVLLSQNRLAVARTLELRRREQRMRGRCSRRGLCVRCRLRSRLVRGRESGREGLCECF